LAMLKEMMAGTAPSVTHQAVAKTVIADSVT
jgi:hypothetical protein